MGLATTLVTVVEGFMKPFGLSTISLWKPSKALKKLGQIIKDR